MTSKLQKNQIGDEETLEEASNGQYFCEACGRRYIEAAVECFLLISMFPPKRRLLE